MGASTSSSRARPRSRATTAFPASRSCFKQRRNSNENIFPPTRGARHSSVISGRILDANFTENDIILDFATDGAGMVAIQTLPVVNGKGLFSFTIVASDNADGTGNVAEYPLSLDEEGITYIEEEYNPNRFFRVRVDIVQ